MPEPFELTVAESAEKIRDGELKSVALVESLLQRNDRLEPSLKAWVTLDHEKLLASAAQMDAELAHQGPRGPLHGVPVGFKDIFYTAGLKTTACSKIYSDFVPTYDATSVARLKEAGAITMGKLVTTEFACTDPPPTRNPWNPEHTPGGSSSGSAVSVAARTCPAALGSQTAGSTCRPASYNGIVGLKPTYGRISRYGVVPVSWSLDTVGILVRSVEDAAILLGAMGGHDPNDPSSSTEPVPDYRIGLDHQQSPPRIGLVKEFFFDTCDEEVRKATEDAAEKLARAGAAIEEISLPKSFSNAQAVQRVVMFAECAAFHEEFFRDRAEDYGPYLRRIIEDGLLIPALRYLQAQRIRRRFRIEMAAMARYADALLTPSTPAAAPKDLTNTGNPAFQSPWTTAGLPTITIPCGLGKAGLPLGVQLAGPPFDEVKLLAVARWCEATLDVKLMPPGLG